jgi:anti-anti-sigma factor
MNINDLISTIRHDDVLMMRIETEQIKDALVAQDLKQILTHTVKKSTATKFILNLENLTFMTSLGCVAFISVKHAIRDKQGQLVLCNMMPFIRKIFTAKRLLQASPHNGNVAFVSVDSLEDALEMFAPNGSKV